MSVHDFIVWTGYVYDLLLQQMRIWLSDLFVLRKKESYDDIAGKIKECCIRFNNELNALKTFACTILDCAHALSHLYALGAPCCIAQDPFQEGSAKEEAEKNYRCPDPCPY